MSVVTLNPEVPWTWQEAQRGAEDLPAVTARKGRVPVWPSAGDYSHVCWCLVLGMPQVRSRDEHFHFGKMVLIHEVSLSFNFVSSKVSRKKH